MGLALRCKLPWWLVLAALWVGAACVPWRPHPVPYEFPNPVLIPVRDSDYLWEHLVTVVGDYFRIAREERVKVIGETVTEGFLETAPEIGSTILEPWRGDAVGAYNQVENTLQSMRRRCVCRVIPASDGYLIEVIVYKELEDVPMPENATAGEAAFRFDGSIPRFHEPVGPAPVTKGWIPRGRDTELEQRILQRLANDHK